MDSNARRIKAALNSFSIFLHIVSFLAEAGWYAGFVSASALSSLDAYGSY